MPRQGRAAICKKASSLTKANGLPSAPTGANCIDIELYKVHQGKPITIKETEDLQLDPMKAFPIVEALFGPRACSNRPGAKPSVKCFVIVRWPLHGIQKRRLFKALGSSCLRPAAEQLYSHVWLPLYLHGNPARAFLSSRRIIPYPFRSTIAVSTRFVVGCIA